MPKPKQKHLLFMAKVCEEFENTASSEGQAGEEVSEHAESIDYVKKALIGITKQLDDELSA